MNRLFLMVVLVAILFPNTFLAQDFSGTYTVRHDGTTVTLKLLKSDAKYTGTVSSEEGSLDVSGSVQNGMLSGRIGDELDGIVFEARLNGGELLFTMVQLDDNDVPVTETAETYSFQKTISGKSAVQQQKKKTAGEIFINNKALTKNQMDELEKTYHIRPLPGSYWYDAVSGLYGVKGYPAFGFMLPGHAFGALHESASNGNTKTYINGRELPMSEYIVWSNLVGSWIQPGKYWLDAQGNAGYEGNAAPVINLYVLAQQRSYKGQGGGGDNFWSSRFSAGNSNADNTQGYVSVPGYGPVGYGF